MPPNDNSLTGGPRPTSPTSGSGLISVPSYTNATASTTGSNYSVWNDWVFNTSGSATSVIWSRWNERHTTDCTTDGFLAGSNIIRPRYAPSAPERAAEAAAAAARNVERGLARIREVETAELRAEGLLQEHLTERQKYDLSTKGHFDVVNFKSKRHYRIRRGRAQNVFLLDGPGGREVKRLCCHPNERVPDADTMLAQKLLIEFNEELFLKTANITCLMSGLVQTGAGLQATG